VWGANQEESTVSSEQSQTSTSDVGGELSDAQVIASSDYLKIDQLQIKLRLNYSTKDISYRGDSDLFDSAGEWIVSEDMKKIDDANQFCAGDQSGVIGRLERAKDATYWSETPIEVDNITSFKLGDYYYVFRPLQAECSQDESISQQRVVHVESFKEILKTIQAE
jgi:hypothetical protein